MEKNKVDNLITKMFPVKGKTIERSTALLNEMKAQGARELTDEIYKIGEYMESKEEDYQERIRILFESNERLGKEAIEHHRKMEEMKSEIEQMQKTIEQDELCDLFTQDDVNRLLEEQKEKLQSDFERILDNRIRRALAEQKEKGVDIDIMRHYKELVKAERVRTTFMLQNKMVAAQILTPDSVIRFSRSNAPVIAFTEDGRSFFMRWSSFYTSVFEGGVFNPDPFSHFMVVPRITKEDILGPDKCEGCKYHNESGDNICQLPACIKDNEGIQE